MSVGGGPVIASRLVAEDGQVVAIEVGKATAVRGGAECAFRIGDRTGVCRGSDGLAALYHALIEIGERLALANHDVGRARFAADARLGFPKPVADAGGPPIRPEDVQEPVAERTITYAGQRYSIVIGRPFRPPDGELALCPFRVDDRPVAVAGGWDGMQALLTALSMIGGWLGLRNDWPVSTAP